MLKCCIFTTHIFTGNDSDGVELSSQELKLQKPTQTHTRLCKPIQHRNRNVMCNNYFISIESVDMLCKPGLTLEVTMQMLVYDLKIDAPTFV